MKRCALLILMVAVGQAAEESVPGAKEAFFIDPTTGNKVKESVARGQTKPRAGTQTRTRGGASAELKPVSSATLRYWIELQTEKGMLRVNANRPFRNGERIRLHVQSNVDGLLNIMQSQGSEPFRMLFPPREGIDNSVQAYQEKVFPSETGFFRFDSRAGAIRLLLMVKAAPLTQIASTAPGSGGPSSSGEPQTRTTRRPATTEAEILAELEKQRVLPKGLDVEMDNSPAQAATYVRADSGRNPTLTPGVIVAEVNLVQTEN